MKVTESSGSGLWAHKVEQLNAALTASRLLHLQQLTHFFLPSPADGGLCFLEGF